MPCLRTSSVTFTPASACFRIAMILSSVNRDFFIRVLPLRKTLLRSGPALQGVTSGLYVEFPARNLLCRAGVGKSTAQFEWKLTEVALRRKAVGALVAEVRARGLTGQALRCYVF